MFLAHASCFCARIYTLHGGKKCLTGLTGCSLWDTGNPSTTLKVPSNPCTGLWISTPNRPRRVIQESHHGHESILSTRSALQQIFYARKTEQLLCIAPGSANMPGANHCIPAEQDTTQSASYRKAFPIFGAELSTHQSISPGSMVLIMRTRLISRELIRLDTGCRNRKVLLFFPCLEYLFSDIEQVLKF